MSNSPLVNYTKISPNSSNPRNKPITKITIHHVAGNLTVEAIGNVFAPASRKASSNYGVDNKGRIGMYVEEKNRAWASANADNDNQAVTIEVSNNGGAPNWPVSDIALAKTIELCVDICKRNDIKKLNFTGDKTGNLTMHKWFAATACPGPYLESKFPYIASEVNKRLNVEAPQPTNPTDVLYRVQAGAFSVKANAGALLAKVKSAGFDTYMVKVNGLYKVQVGAYAVKANAEKTMASLKSKGFDAFITTESGTAASTSEVTTLNIGDMVKLASGAPSYGTSKQFASWVYSSTLYLRELSGNRAVISTLKTGAITGAVDKKYLTKI